MDNELIDRLVPILMKHNPKTKIGAAIVLVELFQAMREPTDKMMVAMECAEPQLECFLEKEKSPSYLVWIAAIDAVIND